MNGTANHRTGPEERGAPPLWPAALALVLIAFGATGCAFGVLTAKGPIDRGRPVFVTVVRQAGSPRLPKTTPGLALRPGDGVSTGPGSVATLTVRERLDVTLCPNSEILLDDGVIHPRAGRVFLTTRATCRVETSLGEATVGGGHFLIDLDAQGRLLLTVLAGDASIRSPKALWPDVRLTPGQMFVAGPALAPRVESIDPAEARHLDRERQDLLRFTRRYSPPGVAKGYYPQIPLIGRYPPIEPKK